MSNQANFIATNYPLNELNILEEQNNELMSAWKNEIFYSHDAPYILRKRALLLDLCNLEAPCESIWKEAMFSDDMLTDKTKHNFYQEESLQDPIKKEMENFFEEDFSYNIDNSWHLNCHSVMQ